MASSEKPSKSYLRKIPPAWPDIPRRGGFAHGTAWQDVLMCLFMHHKAGRPCHPEVKISISIQQGLGLFSGAKLKNLLLTQKATAAQ